MAKRFPDAMVLDALWAWCGHVEEAAKSIRMNRGTFYDRLHGLGAVGHLKELRDTGRLMLSGLSGLSEYHPTDGTVRYIQPVQDSLIVRMKSGEAPPNFQGNMSAAAQAEPTTVQRQGWRPKPSRATTIAFRQAVLDLARVGKDTTEDVLLDLLAESGHFQAFMAELLALYRTKSAASRE